MLSQKILSNPANYLYMFASESFIKSLDSRSATIIAAKAFNQKKVIINEVTNDGYEAARAELRQAIIDTYGMTPAKCLTELAAGHTVAGKNWNEGVYGVSGANKLNTFSQDSSVTVDPNTGAISKAGTVVSSESTALIGTNKKHNNVIGYTYTDESGTCYTSQYNKLTGKYYCGTRTDKDGVITKADGSKASNADMNSIWTSIISGLTDFLLSILDKLKIGPNETVLTDQNTLPSQKDGFVTSDNSDITPYLVLGGAVAAAVVLPKVLKGKKK